MRSPLIDTPEALDAAVVANLHARREKVVQAVRHERVRTWAAFGVSGCAGIFALVAFFFAGDHKDAAIIAMMVCMANGVTYAAGKTGQRKAANSLKEIDRSM